MPHIHPRNKCATFHLNPIIFKSPGCRQTSKSLLLKSVPSNKRGFFFVDYYVTHLTGISTQTWSGVFTEVFCWLHCFFCYIGKTVCNVKARWDEQKGVRKTSEPGKHLSANPDHMFEWKCMLHVCLNMK